MDRNGRPKEDGARSDRGEMCYASRDGPPVELPRRRQRHRRRAPGRRFWQTIGNCGTAKLWELKHRPRRTRNGAMLARLLEMAHRSKGRFAEPGA